MRITEQLLRTFLPVALVFLIGACGPSGQVTTTAPPVPPPTPTATVHQPVVTQPTPEFSVNVDTVTYSRYDTGRMWTFDNPPRDYLRETHDFTPDNSWYDRARLGALRFATYCSASFVSPEGLILTNHHCARESITSITEEGEDFAAYGFIATTREEERRVEDLYVEQLIELFDVTDRIEAATASGETAAERVSLRGEAIQQLQEELAAERGGESAGIRVQIVEFYSGAKYSAYVYRRYDDIRMVFAPEDDTGFFGGDPDNFTYPRYSLDYTFLRAYGPDGRPVDTSRFFFPWSDNGTVEDELVFVIGNPGSTTRLETVAELLFRRDVREPAVARLYRTRAAVYENFITAKPDHPDVPELKDTWFSLSNGRKALTGMAEGLQDDYIIARRAAAERDFRNAINADPTLAAEYGHVLDAIAANRRQARETAAENSAFLGMSPGSPVASTILGRALYAFGASTGRPQLRQTALSVEEDGPDELELALLEAKLEDFLYYFGSDDPVVLQALQGRTPAEAARHIMENSVFRTHEGTQEVIRGDLASSSDPAIAIARLVWPRFLHFQQQSGVNALELEELSGELARARFAIDGTDIPPDATMTLRINDGVVKGFPYNGTVAPPYSTFWGMYDRYYSFQGTSMEEFYQLPERWLPVPEALDLNTPYNFVTTNDIIGGNSGSPLVNRNLEVVGVAFDGNIQSLPGDYIYLSDVNRTVAVDSRAMLHVLEAVYDAPHIARELREGKYQLVVE